MKAKIISILIIICILTIPVTAFSKKTTKAKSLDEIFNPPIALIILRGMGGK